MRRLFALSIVFLLAAILIMGCSTTTEGTPNTQITPAPVIIPAPTPETTFISPTGSGKTISPTIVPASTQIQEKNDPLIGTWTLKNAPYSGTAMFFEGGTGYIQVGISLASTKKQMVWSYISKGTDNERTYHVALENSNSVTNATLYPNYTIYSDALPEGSYLERYR